ncbi:MAG: right-handed parallel beta-helix repeat-containing protein, partial [Candidatus Eisenbacteria sp.]|nr:right-handed parallel beta-helix repeat-containing protein [Candidatus Eisenbacteria bacterium]
MARKLLAVLLVLTAPWAACATTYLVLPDGSGDFPTIQAAVDAASDGDQILLASGTFAGDGNRDVSLLGKAITLRSQVDDPTACIIDCGGAAGNARRAFLFVNGEGENSILRSVTVTNGWLEGWDWQDGTGGAVYCYAASPTIERCVFSGNSARAGGAMTVYYGSNPAIIDCTFEGNDAYTAGNGGGLLISASVHPLVSGCVFRNNGGTGISSEGTGTEVRNCEFSGPTHFGMSCGAVYVYPYVIDRCRFFSNLDSGLRCTSPGGTISSCEFWDNEANRGSALLLVFGFAGTISDCLFYENRAADSGGAVWCGDATATFESCTMAYNEAASGAGGIDCGTATVTLENTIIAFST